MQNTCERLVGPSPTESYEPNEEPYVLMLRVVGCPSVARAMLLPASSEFRQIPSVAPVWVGTERLQINWQDREVPIDLRAAAFAIAQQSAFPTIEEG